MNGKITEKDAYNVAWKHFEFHAKQRLSLLQFYLIFTGVLATAIVTIFSLGGLYSLGIFLGILMAVKSLLFYKLDHRNKLLTKVAETVIREFERKFDFSYDNKYLDKIKVFTKAQEIPTEPETKQVKNIFTFPYSHGRVYKIIFVIFGFLGVASFIVFSILQVFATI
ncbi:MAG: hypothetical protein FWB72_04205 [Firmicutes bacterium]|nr:hypothetical protein [Bacillota bacterium]